MKIYQKIRLSVLAALVSFGVLAQEKTPAATEHTFDFRGQLSAWGQFAPDVAPSIWSGGRYMPQLNYEMRFESKQKVDFELSANLFGDAGIHSFSKADAEGKIKPYRAWARYSTQQLEVRLGLQKINFGSAQMFRPLMWFDAIDPRDPLQLTDGVWGGLFRYYFRNNANLWFWVLYGNDSSKGWEIAPGSQSAPEIGGRAQLPLKQGEIALSYHFRKADFSTTALAPFGNVPENRLGFDIRLDRLVGLWLEGSWTHLTKNAGELTNQVMVTLGGDYTFGLGNGLGACLEQLLFSYDEKAFGLNNVATLSGLTLTYPVSVFDNVNAMCYYDWTNNDVYGFLNWQHDFKHVSLYAMLYWNPEKVMLPAQMSSNRFTGKGIQLMLVWNH